MPQKDKQLKTNQMIKVQIGHKTEMVDLNIIFETILKDE
jgi:hypothetical protein